MYIWVISQSFTHFLFEKDVQGEKVEENANLQVVKEVEKKRDLSKLSITSVQVFKNCILYSNIFEII